MSVDVVEAFQQKKVDVISNFFLYWCHYFEKVYPRVEEIGVPDIFVVIMNLILNGNESWHNSTYRMLDVI